MKSSADAGVVAFRLVETLLAVLKLKGALSTDEYLGVFDAASNQFPVGSAEHELLQELLLQLAEMPPNDMTPE